MSDIAEAWARLPKEEWRNYSIIEKGICPRRVNGTLGVSPRRGVEALDLSSRAPIASGHAFAQAIRDYCAKYPGRA